MSETPKTMIPIRVGLALDLVLEPHASQGFEGAVLNGTVSRFCRPAVGEGVRPIVALCSDSSNDVDAWELVLHYRIGGQDKRWLAMLLEKPGIEEPCWARNLHSWVAAKVLPSQSPGAGAILPSSDAPIKLPEAPITAVRISDGNDREWDEENRANRFTIHGGWDGLIEAAGLDPVNFADVSEPEIPLQALEGRRVLAVMGGIAAEGILRFDGRWKVELCWETCVQENDFEPSAWAAHVSRF